MRKYEVTRDTLALPAKGNDFWRLLSVLVFPMLEAIDRLGRENSALRKENDLLRRRKKEAEIEAQREKLRFGLIRAVSHDLRTPLTTIAGASDLLVCQGEKLDEAARDQLCRNIQAEARWLNRMVENLLLITKISGGAVQIKKEDALVEEIFEEAMTRFRRREPEQAVEVQVPRNEILIAPMDTVLMEQVLLNLLENAAHYAGAAGPLAMSAWREGDKIAFCVRDHGPGIDEQAVERLFHSDFTKADSERGLGIGLSVCAVIVRAHGGAIYAFNAPGGGAEFRFTLPLEEEVSALQEE